MNPHHPTVASRAEFRCEYCRAPEAVFNFPLEVEHVIPLTRGGGDDESNLALACRSCNLRKGIHVAGTDPDSGAETLLFHPRRDKWHDHFRLNGETGAIMGLTPIGRATVVRLDVNSKAQVAARRQWMRLHLFP